MKLSDFTPEEAQTLKDDGYTASKRKEGTYYMASTRNLATMVYKDEYGVYTAIFRDDDDKSWEKSATDFHGLLKILNIRRA